MQDLTPFAGWAMALMADDPTIGSVKVLRRLRAEHYATAHLTTLTRWLAKLRVTANVAPSIGHAWHRRPGPPSSKPKAKAKAKALSSRQAWRVRLHEHAKNKITIGHRLRKQACRLLVAMLWPKGKSTKIKTRIAQKNKAMKLAYSTTKKAVLYSIYGSTDSKAAAELSKAHRRHSVLWLLQNQDA